MARFSRSTKITVLIGQGVDGDGHALSEAGGLAQGWAGSPAQRVLRDCHEALPWFVQNWHSWL